MALAHSHALALAVCFLAVANFLVFLEYEWKKAWRLVTGFGSYLKACELCRRVQRGEIDPIRRAIDAEVTAIFVRKTIVVIGFYRFVLSGYLAMAALWMAAGLERYYNPSQDWVILSGAILSILVSRLPEKYLAKATLFVWQIPTLVLGLVYLLMSSHEPGLLVLSYVATLFPRMATIACCPRPFILVVANLAFTLSWRTLCTTVGNSRYLFIVEATGFASTLWLSISEHASAWKTAREMVKSRQLGATNAAMERLLNLSCDVSLELDSDLQIIAGAQHLLAFLTMDPARNLGGTTLHQFMPNVADKVRFKELLAPSANDDAVEDHKQNRLPGALHVTLKGSNDQLVKVEIYYAFFQSVDGQSRLLVGLREFTDNQVLQPLPPRPIKLSKASHRRNGSGNSRARGGDLSFSTAAFLLTKPPSAPGACRVGQSPPRSVECSFRSESSSSSPSSGHVSSSSSSREGSQRGVGGGGAGGGGGGKTAAAELAAAIVIARTQEAGSGDGWGGEEGSREASREASREGALSRPESGQEAPAAAATAAAATTAATTTAAASAGGQVAGEGTGPGLVKKHRKRRKGPTACFPTKEIAKVATAVQTLRQWSLGPLQPGEASSELCCGFHRAIKEMGVVVESLKAKACMPAFRPLHEAQCRSCGVLDTWDDWEDIEETGPDAGLWCSICKAETLHRLEQIRL